MLDNNMLYNQLNLKIPAKDVGNDKGFSPVISGKTKVQPLQPLQRLPHPVRSR